MAKKYTDVSTGTPYEDNVILVANATTGALRRVTVAQLLAATGTDPGGGGSAPTVSSATCPDAGPGTVVVVFSQSMTAVTTAGWSFKKNGSAWSVSSVTGSGTTWTFTMGSSAVNGDTLLRSYDSTTGATIGTTLELVSFTDSAVTNSVASGYDTDAQTYFTAHETLDSAYTSGQKTALSTFFAGLKTDGLWTSKIQAMYLWRFGTATAHKWNLRNPVDSDGAFRAVFSGSHTHAASGITPDGTTGYADSKYVLQTNGTDNDSSYGVYIATSSVTAGADLGVDGGGASYHHIEFDATDVYGIADSFTAGTYVTLAHGGTNNGFWVASRTSSTSLKLYKDGTQVGSTATTTNDKTHTDIGANNFYLLGKNSAGTPSYGKRKQSFAFIGKGMSDTDVTNFNTRLSTLLAAL